MSATDPKVLYTGSNYRAVVVYTQQTDNSYLRAIWFEGDMGTNKMGEPAWMDISASPIAPNTLDPTEMAALWAAIKAEVDAPLPT